MNKQIQAVATSEDYQYSDMVSFDVTCVIGRVILTTNGEESPTMAAMRLIADHDAEGHFEFPLADGRTQHVTVERLTLTPAEMRQLAFRPTVEESDGKGPMMQIVIDGQPVGEWFPVVRDSIQRLPMWDQLITMNMASRFELRVK